MKQESIKPAQTKLSLAFCVFTSALCETVLVLFGVNGWGYTHSLCCLFGRGACTVSARGRWMWALRCASLADTPIPPGVLSQWGRSLFPGVWSRCCRGTAKAAVLEFANGSVSRVRDGHSLNSAFTLQVQCLFSGLGSTRCGFFRPSRGTDTSTIWFWGIRYC